LISSVSTRTSGSQRRNQRSRKSACWYRPPRHIQVSCRPVSGLTSGFPGESPSRLRSGTQIHLDSLTVAGAAPELSVRRTGFPFHPVEDCPWDTCNKAVLTVRLMLQGSQAVIQAIESRCCVKNINVIPANDCREKVRPESVERLAWAMQEVEQRMEQLPRRGSSSGMTPPNKFHSSHSRAGGNPVPE
jgi:hypothetical protein